MTNGTDLAELLASARVDGRPPSVAELRQRGRRARRRRLGAVAAAGLAVLAVGVMVAATRRPPTYDVATVDSTTVPPPTASPSATEAQPVLAGGEEGGPAVLLPSEGWQLAVLEGGGYTAPDATVRAVTGPAGPLGPMAWIRFNAGVETIEYPDGPATHHDTTSPAGHTVRVGWSAAPEDLAAIRVVEGGSLAITSFDLDETELLSLIDSAAVVDGRVEIDTAALPAGFTAGPTTPDRPYLTFSYALRGAAGAVNVSISRWVGAGSDVSAFIRYRPGIVERTIDGRPALIASADPTTDNQASALLVDSASWDEPGWAYSFTILPPTDTAPGATAAEVETLLSSLRAVEHDELLAELPADLEDRQAAIDRWLADAPVPATADLGVLREGPPLNRSEAEWFYQVLKCSVVLDWAITGNDERLDQVAASATWTVGADMNRYWEDLVAKLADQKLSGPPRVEDLVPRPGVLASARTATTDDARWATTLVDDCRWAMSLTGQRRS